MYDRDKDKDKDPFSHRLTSSEVTSKEGNAVGLALELRRGRALGRSGGDELGLGLDLELELELGGLKLERENANHGGGMRTNRSGKDKWDYR